MKTATKNLEEDHIHVLKLTDVMRAVTRSKKPDIEHIENIIDIIRNFADGLHHAKEENLFFPALENKGFSAKQGPVAVMLHEHIQGRNFVKGIVENLELYKNGDNAAITGIYHNMSGYADLLLNHITKENNVLFRMADNTLSHIEQKNLLSQFEEIEQNRPAGTRVSDYILRINDLALLYKV
ncbi:MAG TPA: hemerythrin domain-containing protein [Bacteroidales bacterium]|jgi:hemerythrin-like domain-containing protein